MEPGGNSSDFVRILVLFSGRGGTEIGSGPESLSRGGGMCDTDGRVVTMEEGSHSQGLREGWGLSSPISETLCSEDHLLHLMFYFFFMERKPRTPKRRTLGSFVRHGPVLSVSGQGWRRRTPTLRTVPASECGGYSVGVRKGGGV